MNQSDEVNRHQMENMHGEIDDQHISSGWSLTVGDLKKVLEDIPDDYEVMLCNADVDEVDISEIRVDTLYPPALGSPGLFVLSGGMVVNSEYAFHDRMDVHFAVGGAKRWSETDKSWAEEA